MKSTMVRRVLTAGTALVVVATAALAAYATVLDPVADRQGTLVSFGPLMDNGFPTSYKDSHAVRLEACFTGDDPLCAAAAGPTYDPDLPVSFPTNFPDEFFYQLASATVPATAAGLLVEFNLEGAFASGDPAPGEQIVFARIRIRDKTVPAGTTWRITHPYGVDELTADAGGINVTQDAGVAAGIFTGALAGRVGPFIKWDPAVAPAAPAGYTGDPSVLHKVVGSPYGTNFIKVEQKNPDGSYSLVGQWDDLFSVQGRMAVNSGVDVNAASFTGNDSGGFLDVYASSDAGQSIVVSANAALGTPTIPMREIDGRYYARIEVDTKILAGTQIEVVNTGDNPVAKKLFTITDQVDITAATYNADTGDLTVQATSTDTESGADTPVLTLAGFGPLASGQATFNMTAPPSLVKVTSSVGGSDTSTLTVTGAGFAAQAPVAQFSTPLTAEVGQAVPLDGRASIGDITSYSWSTNDGNVTPSATPGLATWVPSTANAAATVTLQVTGPGGTASVTNTVNVLPAAVVTANAGPDQVKTRGTLVSLAGSATGQNSVTWTQLSGPTVTLSSTTTLNPTFTYTKMALPVGPAGHVTTGYVVHNEPIVLQLTARAPNGVTTAIDTVQISPTVETITPGTARYRTGTPDWRVTGTTSIRAGQVVAIVLGSNLATGRFIGQATVDAVGAFSFRGGAQPVAAGTTVTYVSATGGTVVGPLLITR